MENTSIKTSRLNKELIKLTEIFSKEMVLELDKIDLDNLCNEFSINEGELRDRVIQLDLEYSEGMILEMDEIDLFDGYQNQVNEKTVLHEPKILDL